MTTDNTTPKLTPAQLEARALEAMRNADRFAHYDGMREFFTRAAIGYWRALYLDTKQAEQRAEATRQISELEAWLGEGL